MDFKFGKFFCIWGAVLLAANALIYGIYHLTYAINNPVVDIIFVHVANFWDFLFPAVVVILMLTAFVFKGGWYAVLCSAFAATKFPYLLFYDYISEFRNFGEGVTAAEFVPKFEFSKSLVIAAIGTLFTLLQILLLFLLCYLFFRYRLKSEVKFKSTLELRVALGKDMVKKTLFGFEHPVTSLVLFLCSMQLVIYGGLEIYDVVTYFIEVGSSFMTQDILYIIWRFLFLIGLIPLCHLIVARVRCFIFRKKYRIAVSK